MSIVCRCEELEVLDKTGLVFVCESALFKWVMCFRRRVDINGYCNVSRMEFDYQFMELFNIM